MKATRNYSSGTRGFLEWLRDNQPAIYRQVMPKLPKAQLSGIGLVATDAPASATPPATSSWLKDLITTASQVYLTKEQISAQKRILDMQLRRAEAGLAPLEIDQDKYGVPSASVKVGIAGDTQKLLLWGGLAVVGLFLARKLF